MFRDWLLLKKKNKLGKEPREEEVEEKKTYSKTVARNNKNNIQLERKLSSSIIIRNEGMKERKPEKKYEK